MTTVEILKAARAKIADEKHWTQIDNARDVNDNPVSLTSQEAVCWCSNGALFAVITFDIAYLRSRKKAESFLKAYMNPGVIQFNDSHTHAEVIAAWDAAIANAEKAVTA